MDKYELEVIDIIGNWNNFLDTVFKDIASYKIDVSQYELDHIAYRSITDSSFNEVGKKLEMIAKRINRNTIRNRFIDIYKFDIPLFYNGRTIKFIEHTAPAEGDIFKEGLEHVEFIINNISLEDFVKKHKDLNWNLNSINREIGAEIGLLFENNANIKFKTMSMPEIIRLESKQASQ